MDALTWNGCSDPQAPIVVIGAGRSGSSLLARILGSHPAICFDDENDFLVPKLWLLLWENRRPRPMRGEEKTAVHDREAVEHALEARLAPLVARCVVSFLGINPDHNHWGFKEVWNGSGSHRYSWRLYDILFPRATWVHLVRHPLDFAASCAAWNGDELTDAYLEARLADWTAMVEYSRLRRDRERYFEVRFEDVITQPRASVQPILTALGLDWFEECAAPLKRRIMASPRQRAQEEACLRRFFRSRLLAATAASLGYDL
jgi:hypothetical protein